MNVEQVCARLCPKPLGPLKDINILWNLWAVVFLYKAKRRVGSKVNKISDEEYFYFTFTLFLDFKSLARLQTLASFGKSGYR